ncbi:13424_t:CDS:1 [Funneliformis geosporum]|uniref:13424_t:CDS:1 n=1 Tax=Funneliformis geosporum TaxID=1117311 RepID=A0A9W4WI46_9GLOM|nr:13424_t:CDS:1 [Funneliformis geosporum]
MKFGLISLNFLASTLKIIIRQPRPYHMTISSQPFMTTKLRKSYGMPSSHSAIFIYFATFVSLRLFDSSLLPLNKLLSSLMVYIIALLVLWSRVELGHHTTAQVLMGMFLGIFLAMYWNDLWVNYWTPLLFELKLDGQLGFEELKIMWNFVNEFINENWFENLMI